MKMAVFWVVTPCSLVEVYQRFRGPCCFHHQANSYTILVIKAEGKLLLGNASLQHDRILLKCISNKSDVSVLSGFNWPKIGFSDGFCEQNNKPSNSIKVE
jgi:hypothetical protein